MEAASARHARDVAIEERDGAGVRRELPGDQVEERGLAGPVGADDEPALARLDDQIDARGDAQPAERFVETADGERAQRPVLR
jgi:hypothetical protein